MTTYREMLRFVISIDFIVLTHVMSAGVPSLDKKLNEKSVCGVKADFYICQLTDKSSGLSVISH